MEVWLVVIIVAIILWFAVVLIIWRATRVQVRKPLWMRNVTNNRKVEPEPNRKHPGLEQNPGVYILPLSHSK